MSTPVHMRFFLMKDVDNSIYYYWDRLLGLQQVTDTTIATKMTNSIAAMPDPMNWPDIVMGWDRHSTMLGMFPAIPNSFTFVKEAAAIICAIGLSQGVYGDCYLRIQMSVTDDPAGHYFKDLNIVRLDFKGLEPEYFSENTGQITMGVLPSELFELLQAYGDTEYNVMMYKDEGTPILDPDVVPIYTDGVKLQANYSFIGADGTAYVQDIAASTANINWIIPPMSNIQPPTPYFGNEIVKNNILINEQIGDGSIGTSPGGGTTNLWLNSDYALKFLNITTSMQCYLMGRIGVTTDRGLPYTDNFKLTIALLGVSADNVVRSVNVLYERLIINAVDTEIDLGDNSWTGGRTTPTVYSTKENPTTITLSSTYGTGNPDGLIYTIGFNLSSPTHSGAGTSFFLSLNNWSGTPADGKTFTVVAGGGVRYPASGTATLRYYKLWEKIVPLMASTQGNYGFPIAPVATPFTGVSSYLSDPTVSAGANVDCKPYDLVVTSGNAMRLFPYYNYITTSVNNVIKDMMHRLAMAVGIEGDSLRAEKIDYWFDNATMIADLTPYEITNFKWENFTHYMGNNLTVGNNSQPFNQMGTLDDHCLSQDYRLPTKRIIQKIDWTAPFVASPYQQEKARANQQSNITGTDPTSTNLTISEQDNDVYVLEIDTTTTNSDTVYSATPIACKNLKRYTWVATAPPLITAPSIAGLQYPDTAYNLGQTPKSMLYRNGKLLASMCWPVTGQKLIFQTADQTGRIKTDKLQKFIGTPSTITEYSDVLAPDLGTPLFLPILFSFDCPQPVNLYEIMTNNPRGYIKFKWMGNIYKGFIWEAGIKPAQDALFSFKLLATYDTNTNNLQMVA